jgi:hypothetical protein
MAFAVMTMGRTARGTERWTILVGRALLTVAFGFLLSLGGALAADQRTPALQPPTGSPRSLPPVAHITPPIGTQPTPRAPQPQVTPPPVPATPQPPAPISTLRPPITVPPSGGVPQTGLTVPPPAPSPVPPAPVPPTPGVPQRATTPLPVDASAQITGLPASANGKSEHLDIASLPQETGQLDRSGGNRLPLYHCRCIFDIAGNGCDLQSPKAILDGLPCSCGKYRGTTANY